MARPLPFRRRMHRVAALTVFLAAVGCEDDGPTVCNLDTGDASTVGDVTAVYTATTTGDGAISSLSYTADDGVEAVTNPTLPFSVTVTLTTARASIEATGSVSDGQLAIGYALSDATGPVEQIEDTCSG